MPELPIKSFEFFGGPKDGDTKDFSDPPLEWFVPVQLQRSIRNPQEVPDHTKRIPAHVYHLAKLTDDRWIPPLEQIAYVYQGIIP